MNARTNIQKTKGLFIALIASLTFVGCGSFQGASYFSSDGIYTTKTQVRTERTVRPQRTNSNNSSYYSEYFKDAAAGTVAENEVFFTDTENYTSEQNYYYNDPFRFGYGGFVTPFMNPYYGYGGFAGASTIILASPSATVGVVGIDGTVGTDGVVTVMGIMVISEGTTTHLLWRALNLVVAKKIMKVQDEQIVEYRNEMQKHRIKM